MALAKQAKILNPDQLALLLNDAASSRNPTRDRLIILLSFKAGLRACEIANLSWSMVTDASGDVADTIALTDAASKTVKNRNMRRSSGGGRNIPMHPMLQATIEAMKGTPTPHFARRGGWPQPTDPVCPSEQGRYSPNAIAVWFHLKFKKLGLQGASSHSGRRTFITQAARAII
ncbi:MAG TPA: tyrosine-type recombinase/integrase, partial [Gemmatimonadaceae bacterium]|nr:tyrosine-type recombinase/integrase [Gemmatimonadaceae bacterium]